MGTELKREKFDFLCWFIGHEFHFIYCYYFSSVGCDTEKILLSAWSHPLFTKLTDPSPPPADAEIQSEPLPGVVSPTQLDVELVKVEVVVMTEDEQEEVEETVIARTMSPVEQEASNESSALGEEECSVTPVILEVDRSDMCFPSCRVF